MLRCLCKFWCGFWCVLVVLGFVAASANAGQVVNVYRAETLVKSQSDAERNAAARATFGQVIVRVSGQRSALEHPAVQAAINNAQNYLFGFTYQSTHQKITDNGKVFSAVKLQLNYSPEAIDQLLRQSQLPLWPAQRPKVLVWLVAQDKTGLHLVPDPGALQAMQAQAIYRGLPVVTPKMDLEDSLSLSAEDIWKLDVAKIEAASARYKADAILVGRYTPYSMGPIPPAFDPNAIQPEAQEVFPEPVVNEPASTATTVADAGAGEAPVIEPPQGPWIGEWQLIQGANTQVFADETPEVAGLFESAIDRAADYFAAQYAITPTNQGPQSIVLSVGNITNFGDFKRAQAYLRGLAMVRRMDVLRVNSDGLLVSLTTEGDLKLLMGTLALGRKLSPIASESMSVLEAAEAQTEVEQPVAIDASTSVTQPGTMATHPEGLDPAVLAELEAELAAEQGIALPSAVQQADPAVQQAPMGNQFAQPVTPTHAGTNDDPLLYLWQAK